SAAVLIAVAASSARMNSKVRMEISSFSWLGTSANLLDRSYDIGVCPAPADITAHQFLYGCIVGPTRLLEQSNRRHDLTGRAISTLVAVTSKECGLHGMQGGRRADTFNRCDLFAIVH